MVNGWFVRVQGVVSMHAADPAIMVPSGYNVSSGYRPLLGDNMFLQLWVSHRVCCRDFVDLPSRVPVPDDDLIRHR